MISTKLCMMLSKIYAPCLHIVIRIPSVYLILLASCLKMLGAERESLMVALFLQAPFSQGDSRGCSPLACPWS